MRARAAQLVCMRTIVRVGAYLYTSYTRTGCAWLYAARLVGIVRLHIHEYTPARPGRMYKYIDIT